jgi:hypothetical protein
LIKFELIFRNPPKSPEDWIRLLQLQESLHAKEMRKWQRVLNTALDLLKKVSTVCESFAKDPTVSNKKLLIKDEL